MEIERNLEYSLVVLGMCLIAGISGAGLPIETGSAVTPAKSDGTFANVTPTMDMLGINDRDDQGSNKQTVTEVMMVTDYVSYDEMETSDESLVRRGEVDVWKWEFSWTWWVVIQLILSLVGVFANLLVVLALLKRRSTNHSTDILIGALAVSDMLTSLFYLPTPRASHPPSTALGHLYCKMMFPYFYKWVCIVASTYTLVTMSVERLVAVIYPLHFRRIFTKRRVYIIVLVVWIGSIISCTYFLTFRAVRGRCLPGFPLSGITAVTFANIVIRMLFPTVVMIVTQTMTAISLHSQSERFRQVVDGEVPVQSFHVVARNRVVRMMSIVNVIFILSWSPSSIAWLCVGLGILPVDYPESNLHWILHLATYVNSSANPFIYAASYPKFRTAIKEIFVGVTEKNMPLFAQLTRSFKPSVKGSSMQTSSRGN